MDSTNQRFFAPGPRGIEGLLEAEIHGLDVPATAKTDGGVGFHTPWTARYRVNLKSHIASRILWEVRQSQHRTETDICRAAYALPWPEWFTPSQTFKVSARRNSSAWLRRNAFPYSTERWNAGSTSL